ncbi:hypothetical protein ACB288_04880 [Aeromonas taiwanensis]
MSKHTQEPWPFFVEWAEPSTPHPESEPIVRLSYDDYQRARYCVNACQGVSNGQLALTSVSGAILMLKEAEQQRDELLAALEEAKSVLSSINTGRQHKVEVEDDEPAFWQRNEWVTWAKGEILPMIEAAIAKAKGGAA